MRALALFILVFLSLYVFPQSFIPGYQKTITGEELSYHSPQPDARVSLLVRSEDSIRSISWETGAADGKGTFLMLAGIDVNSEDPHTWKVLVNDRHLFTISSPLDTMNKDLIWNGPDGALLEMKVKEVDKYGDFMGYLYLNLPAGMTEPGKPVQIKVIGESAASRTWFMVFKYEISEKVSLVAENAVEKTDEGNRQILRAAVVHYGEPLDATIDVGSQQFKRNLGFGYNSLTIPVPEIKADTNISVKITAGGKVYCDTLFTLKPVPYRTIYLLHHSHNDIGYTHVQTEVEQMQWKNLSDAVAMAKASQDYPPEARFKWNVEVMWAVDSYLEQATPEQKADFIAAVKNGWIELDGLYANELTSLCESEELLWLMEPGRRISRECGVPLRSAMITDIPGWTWGLVPALAESGVKYLSLGTNSGHRIGGTIKEWGDKPFYWVSPSGEQKVLCWVHQKGYSLFHTGLDYKKIRKRLQEDQVFEYMNELAASNYPYEMVMLRYTIGSDNGPVDDNLPEEVKAWNEKYVTPKIVISTVGNAFSLFEQKYGSTLPEVTGDFTAYWEDGAYSTARETAMNRASAVRLNQAQILRSMMKPGDYPDSSFAQAWKYLLLYDEHTWGSWNSISEPESDFTQSQWAIKASYGKKAHDQSSMLFMQSLPEVTPEDFPVKELQVINTCSWARSGLVSVPIDVMPPNSMVLDQEGHVIPVQLLSNGELVFLAKEVPALGALTYVVEEGRTLFHLPDEGAPVPMLSNPNFAIMIDETTGALKNLYWITPDIELADTSEWSGINEYVYVHGRSPETPQSIGEARIMPGEDGPVLKSIRIVSRPPGCRVMETEVELITGLDEIYITNTMDKDKVYDQEAVHFAFPFRIPGGVMRYDLAFAQCQVEKDQIKGSNRNYITMENWVDISNDKYGVTVACPDAPLFEVGKITMDEILTGWVQEIEPSQTFFSYVMNNYWETNYAAAQEGSATFSYVIKPHQAFDPLEAEQFGVESRYPLVVIPASEKLKTKSGKSGTKNPEPGIFSSLILISLKPTEVEGESLACLYNPSDKEVTVELIQKGAEFYMTDIDGLVKSEKIKEMTVPAMGIRFIIIKK